MRTKLVIFSLLSFTIFTITAQDSIPSNAVLDTTTVNTIVIRSAQNKIKIIPRGVNLVNPKISYIIAKSIDNVFKRFRMPSFWVKVNKFGLNLSEVAFINWNAGGNNSISGIANVKLARNYKFRHLKWDNNLEVNYGLNAQEGRKLRKTNDAFRVSSTFGYRRDTISNWYYSVKANFNTQFYKGYKYPNRETPISRLMAPGYLFVGAGTSYISEDEKFNLYISPVTQKVTFVLDEDLANRGSFGVEKALVDSEGNILKAGKNTVMELGLLITNKWETKIDKNISLNHRVGFYTDYLKSFGNIDVDWELKLNLTVNKYVNTSIGTHLIYDDDIKFDEVKASDGTITQAGTPKIQFKQLLGVGLAYSF